MTPTVFFTWQNDDPSQKNCLRGAIKKALKQVEKKTGTKYEFDEATRDLPGAPDINAAIIEKIEKASMVIADVSIVIRKDGAPARRHSNSNVMFELGYARAVLGEGRVIHVAKGPLEELPFDIEKKRTMLLDDSIVEGLAAAIKAIHEKQPPTEWERRVAEPAKHKNDRLNVERYMKRLSPRLTIDTIVRLPGHFDSRIAGMYDELEALQGHSEKDMPSPIQDLFESFFQALRAVVDLDNDFKSTSGQLRRLPKSHEVADWHLVRDRATIAGSTLKDTYDAFVGRTRDDFPEIDYDAAWSLATLRYLGGDIEQGGQSPA